MLELRNISKTYKSKKGTNCKALKNINIKFPDNGMVFILGKSGSGKSTLLNIIGGLDAPDSGEIIIQGSSTKEFKAKDYDSYRNTYLGFIFQEFNVLDNFSIYDNVALALKLQNKKAEKAKVNAILKEVGLEGFENRKPNEISGGQRQRVAVARALVKDPKVIFGDEPTGNLDSNTSKQVFNLLQELAKTRLVVIVSHDRDSAEKYADRIIELADGVVVDDVSRVGKQNTEDFSIENNEISLPVHRALTKQELNKINKAQSESEKPLVFKHSKKTSFRKTKEKDSKFKEGFKLIRSRLPNRYATQIGVSNFKSKPFRLIFTIFLTMVSLALFGLSQNFATYDLPNASARSFYDSNITEIVLKQGELMEEFGSLNSSVENIILPDNLNKLNKNYPNLTYNNGYGLPMQFSKNPAQTNILEVIMSMLGKSVSNPYITYSNGLVLLGENYKNRLDEIFNCKTNLIGIMPTDSADHSVVITDYFAQSLINNNIIKITEDFNLDGVINYADLIVEGNENYSITDTFNFKLEICGIIETDYATKFKEVIDSYTLNPTDFSNHKDYSSFSNEVVNNYSVFFTANEDMVNYVKDNYTVAKASRFRFKNTLNQEYFEEKSMDTYETGYMFRKEGIDTYFSSLIHNSEELENLYNTIFSAGRDTFETLKTENKTNGVVISLAEYNRIFKKSFENIEQFKEYFYASGTTIPKDSVEKNIDIGFFKMLSTKSLVGEITSLVVVGVFDITPDVLKSFPLIASTYDNISGVVGDDLSRIINEDNFGLKSLYVKLPNSVKQTEDLLRFADNGYLYHVSEISTTLYMVNEIFNIFSIVFQWVALILGIFSVILLFNFVSLSVINKQKDIGILRALGAKGTDVSKIFMIETLIVGAITTVLSWGLIFVGTELVNILLYNGFKGYLQSTAIDKVALLSVGIWPILAVLIACFVVTLIATIIPTIRISKMKPVDAIKKSN